MRLHEIQPWVAWHGRLMVVAWCILLPLGVLIARFFKVTPNQRWPERLDSKFWWYSHLTLQYSGVAVMSTAVAIAAWHAGFSWSTLSLHAKLGWMLVILGWLQLIGGLLRGSSGGPQRQGALAGVIVHGDHYDMTRRRVIFECIHKTIGYFALALVPVVVALGLRTANAPHWIEWLIGAEWVAGLGIFAWLQWNGRCVDTYQAIWGPAPDLPGNRRRPIGVGIWRYGDSLGRGRQTFNDSNALSQHRGVRGKS